MIGIYKVTSPKGKVYIGQSNDIERRFNEYLKEQCKMQIKLYRSIVKYGANNHSYEILCECGIEELNQRERFYQDKFNVIKENGLNLRLTNTKETRGTMSIETRLRMSLAQKNKIVPEEQRRKISETSKKRKPTLETRLKISKNHAKSKIVLDITTGVFFSSITEAAKSYNINHNTLVRWLWKEKYNKSNLIKLS